jgi:protein subunit release factor A
LFSRHRERTISGKKEGAIMDAVIIEIRAAEGGDDAKLLVQQQMAIYLKVAGRRSL